MIIFISLLIIFLIFFSVNRKALTMLMHLFSLQKWQDSAPLLKQEEVKNYVFVLITFLTLMHRNCSIPRVCAFVVSNHYLNCSVFTYWPYTFYNVTAIKPNNTSLFTPFSQNFFELIIIIYWLFKPKCNFLFVQRTSFFLLWIFNDSTSNCNSELCKTLFIGL